MVAQAQLESFNKHMEINGSQSFFSESEEDTRNTFALFLRICVIAVDAI